MSTLTRRTLAMFLIAAFVGIAVWLPFHDYRSWASNTDIYGIPLVAFAFFGILLFSVVLPFFIYRKKFFNLQ